MVSKVACSSAEAAEKYFDNHLSKGDYFIGESRDRGVAPAGVWLGSLADQMGKQGQAVTRDDFRSFLSSDVVSLGGKQTWKRPRESSLKYVEFTYTAPKAFSVAAALDERLKSELFAAVQDEMTWFEAAAGARDRRGSLAAEEVTRPTGNMMTAAFQHETSRTNDPNFHVHCLIGNMTFDSERDQVLALHYGDMLELRKTLDARIHNNLAARSARLGYHVEVAENGFTLAEVPREAVEMFSQRARQVEAVEQLLLKGYSRDLLEAAVARMKHAGSEISLVALGSVLPPIAAIPNSAAMPKHVAHELAVLLTRPAKEEISSADLRFNTLTKLSEAGLSVLPPSPAPIAAQGVDLSVAIDRGVAAAFDKDAVVRLDQLIGSIVRLAPGAATNQEVADMLRHDSRFVVGRMATQDRPWGVDLVTTKKIVLQERELLHWVAAGLGGAVSAVVSTHHYETPSVLRISNQRIAEMVSQAAKKGEVLTHEMARNWLEQFSGIHRYVSTSEDRFLNIRGGAGVGKTFCMEILVGDSIKAGRNVVLLAPYGEQSRVTMRAEASRLAQAGKRRIADAFREANTVAHFLLKAEQNVEFRASLRGSDVYVDEAGLLDTPTATALAKLATETGARVIFQGDTEQKLAVGRGSPLEVLQQRLNLGMHVDRASISRRQLASEDKRLAQDLSSGDGERFAAALERFIERGDILEVSASESVNKAALKMMEERREGRDVLAFASVHRLCDAISDELHLRSKDATPSLKIANIDSWKAKDLQPAEKLSSSFYEVGNAVEFRIGKKLLSAVVQRVEAGQVYVSGRDIKGNPKPLALQKVTDVYQRRRIERGIGSHLLVTEKIKHGKQVYERNSRHKIVKIVNGMLIFDTGLRLAVDDGRLRQGDVLTVDKAQGAKGKSVLWVEDNRSLSAMANRRDVHVGFTRHVSKVTMMVESIDVFKAMGQREKIKMEAIQLAENTGNSRWQGVEQRQDVQQVEKVKRLALAGKTPSATAVAKLRRLSVKNRGKSRRIFIHRAAVLFHSYNKKLSEFHSIKQTLPV